MVSFVRAICLVLQLVDTIPSIRAKLEAAVVLPHGDFALDPTLLPAASPERQAAEQVASAAATTGHWLSAHINPDLVLLSTPHGIELSNDFALYLGSTASGSAEIGKDLHNATHEPYTVHLPTISLAPRLSRELLSETRHHNVSGVLVSADDSEDMPLHWAEVIPLLLIPPRPDSASHLKASTLRRLTRSSSSSSPRRHLILSHPLRRYDYALDMNAELIELGRILYNFIEHLEESVAVVISADLSHTHRADGPYGYSAASAQFDAVAGRWAAGPCGPNATQQMEEARALQSRALSCGFTGLVLLRGLLCNDDSHLEAHVWANRNATYYGMMVASYERIRG